MSNRNFDFSWEFKNFAIRTVHQDYKDKNSPLRKNCPVELIKYFDEKHAIQLQILNWTMKGTNCILSATDQ